MFCFTGLTDFARQRSMIREVLVDVIGGELLFVALNEMVNNAFVHGCKGIVDLVVKLEITIKPESVCIRVCQPGQGMKACSYTKDLPDDFAESGRGLAIVNLCADKVEYSDDGRIITIWKYAS